MRTPRTCKFLAAFALVCASLALFATAWVVLPAPTYALWLFSVGATEGSLYFGLLGLLGAATGVLAYRGGAKRTGLVSALVGVCAALLSLLPLWQSLPVARENDVRLSPLEYFGLSPADANDAPVQRTTQTYARVAGQTLDYDFYRPAQPSPTARALPAIVVVHGGSWRQGSRSDFARWDRFLAAQGYAVFDIDYRLAPQPNERTATADVQSAVAYVRTHAASLGVAPDRIALMGRSAGGHLALLAAYTAAPASRVQCVVSLYGPTDLVWGYENVAHPDVIDGRRTLTRFLGGTLAQIPETYRQASPVTYAGPASPPTLLIHGGRDRLVGPQHSEMLAAKLGRERAELVIVPYSLHGFDYVFNGWGAQIVRPVLLRFLREHLR